MIVLDATFLIDYLDGRAATEAYYEEHGGAEEEWIVPAPAYAETLVGIGNHPTGDVDRGIEALSWTQVFAVDRELSVVAARIADEVGTDGPYLDGVDALVAAVGRELDAPVVSRDGDLTHPATRRVVDVEEY